MGGYVPPDELVTPGEERLIGMGERFLARAQAAEAALAAERERSGALAEALRALLATFQPHQRGSRGQCRFDCQPWPCPAERARQLLADDDPDAIHNWIAPAPVATEATQEEDGRDR
jgi:hypothetical protein